MGKQHYATRESALIMPALSVLACVSLLVLLTVAFVHNVNYPFPRSFKNVRDACFYAALLMAFINILFIVFSGEKRKNWIALAINTLTIFIAVWFTSRG